MGTLSGQRQAHRECVSGKRTAPKYADSNLSSRERRAMREQAVRPLRSQLLHFHLAFTLLIQKSVSSPKANLICNRIQRLMATADRFSQSILI